MRKSPKFPPEVQERAVRVVFDAKHQYPSQWAAPPSSSSCSACMLLLVMLDGPDIEQDGKA